MRRDRAATAVAALLLTTAVAGCASAADGGRPAAVTPRAAAAPLPVTTTATPSGPSELVLPVAPYLFSDAQSSQLVAAHSELVAACMKRYGFGYRVSTASAAHAALPANESRYGVMTPEQAQYGYHFMAVEMERQQQGAAPSQSPPKVTPAMAAVLTGVPGGQVNGRSVPSGGCNGQATTELGGKDGRYGDPDIAESIQADSFARSQSDARVLKAFAAWSACMRADGYHYPNPDAATNDPRWSASAAPSAAEIATARADVGCKQRTNLVGVWFSVESAYQGAAIKANAEALRQAQATMRQELRTAATLLGSSQ
ncbi:hypothetical protein [Streptacidiphilus cavernicola]|uniref:PknH-like extracellular domain-containing protein n=1 Tax=Streptacidiphilus cavernicola TaxID=3342716 RepID=A0ABV6W5A7_9ACTN